MRRLPVYFLLDVSESMVGEPIAQVEEGLRTIIQDLRKDPYALETVFVAVLAFAGQAHILSSLEELYNFNPPKLFIGDGTALGLGLETLMRDLDNSVQKTTLEVKGDWKPIIFLFTDGVPTDNPKQAINKWVKKYRTKANMVAISLGDADTKILGQLTENVFRLKETTRETFQSFFKWVTASVKTSSMSVADTGQDELKLAPYSINLEKVDPNEPTKVDERTLVLLAKCSKTGQAYLQKYQHDLEQDTYDPIGAYPLDLSQYEKFSGQKPSNKRINVQKLTAIPPCPHCGNDNGFINCGRCQKLSCGYTEGNIFKCPWCGHSGRVSYDDSFDISRERG